MSWTICLIYERWGSTWIKMKPYLKHCVIQTWCLKLHSLYLNSIFHQIQKMHSKTLWTSIDMVDSTHCWGSVTVCENRIKSNKYFYITYFIRWRKWRNVDDAMVLYSIRLTNVIKVLTRLREEKYLTEFFFSNARKKVTNRKCYIFPFDKHHFIPEDVRDENLDDEKELTSTQLI